MTELSPERQIAWDSFVEQSPHCHYRQTCKWLWLTRTRGFTPSVVTVHDATGRIRGGASVLKRVLPGVNRCILLVPYGPVVAASNLSTAQAVCRALAQIARDEKSVFLRVTPYVSATDAFGIGALLATHGFRHRAERWSYLSPAVDLMWVDLDRPPDAVLAAFSASTRHRIRRALAEGLDVDATGRPEAVAALCDLLRETAKRKSFSWSNNDTREHCSRLLAQFGEQAKAILIRHRGRTLAGGLFLAVGTTCWYLYGGTAASTRIQAARVLHWEAMKWAASRGCARYDMLGGVTFPATDAQPGYGTYRFKQSLNAYPVRLLGYYDLVLSAGLYAALGLVERHVFPRMSRWIARLATRSR